MARSLYGIHTVEMDVGGLTVAEIASAVRDLMSLPDWGNLEAYINGRRVGFDVQVRGGRLEFMPTWTRKGGGNEPALSDQRFFTPGEAANLMGVSVDTVRYWIHTGELIASDCSRIRGKKPRWRILESDLEDFRRRRMHIPPPKIQRRRKKGTDGIIEFYK